MKKIISLIIVFIMLMSCIACSGQTPDTGDESTDNASVENTEATEKVKEEYTGTFEVGFARIDMTPDESLLGKIPATDSTSDVFNRIKDKLYATCIAVHDGEKTALILTLDTKHAVAGFVDNICRRIKFATGIDEKDIIVSVTHNHSSPDPGQSGNQYVSRWLGAFYNDVGPLTKEAIEDLSPAEIYIGQEDTKGLAFVRRYLHADGGYSAIQNHVKNNTPIVAHETEADSSLQVIKFERGDKKDIVLANWQAHVAHAIGLFPDSISSDIVGFARDVAEEKDDIHFAYFQGASGNINLNIKIPELASYFGNYRTVGQIIGEKVRKVIDGNSMQKVSAGKISTKTSSVKADVIPVTDELLAQAREVQDSGYDEELIKKYGFATKYDVNATINRSGLGDSVSVKVAAITFGDLAFVAVPYEMFDTNGMEVKDGSPYEMTFVLTCANGHYGYVPSNFAFPHKGYEVNVTKFVQGTAEKFSAKYVEMLKEMKDAE